MNFGGDFVETAQKKDRKSTDAQIRAKMKYANSRWRPGVYIDADKREPIERWFVNKGYKSFNEYVIALIDQDMEKKDKN